MYARRRAVGYTLSVHIIACKASVHALSPVFIPHTEREAYAPILPTKAVWALYIIIPNLLQR